MCKSGQKFYDKLGISPDCIFISVVTVNDNKDFPSVYVNFCALVVAGRRPLNRKKTRLLPLSAKFRRKTIDRKDQIFDTIEKMVLK